MGNSFLYPKRQGFSENLILPIGIFGALSSLAPLLYLYLFRKELYYSTDITTYVRRDYAYRLCASGIVSCIFSLWLSNYSGFMDTAMMYYVVWSVVDFGLHFQIPSGLIALCVFTSLFATEVIPQSTTLDYIIAFAIPASIVVGIFIYNAYYNKSLRKLCLLCFLNSAIAATAWILGENGATTVAEAGWHIYFCWGRWAFHVMMYYDGFVVFCLF